MDGIITDLVCLLSGQAKTLSGRWGRGGGFLKNTDRSEPGAGFGNARRNNGTKRQSRRPGRQTHPCYPMKPSVRASLDDARQRLAGLYGDRLVRVVLYGSQARGDARDESDVDVLVVLRGSINVLAELKQLTDLKLALLEKYDVYVSLQPFTEADYQQRRSPLLINVHAEGIEL